MTVLDVGNIKKGVHCKIILDWKHWYCKRDCKDLAAADIDKAVATVIITIQNETWI
jgi:hypothetical protein